MAAAPSSDLSAARARQAQLSAVRAQLGDTIAANLSAQQQLSDALAENRRQADALTAQLAQANARVAALDAELAAIAERRAALERQIAAEKRELDRLARALYVEPDSLVMELAQSGSLQDLMSQLGGLESAARRARGVQQQLARDEAQVAADQKREAEGRAQEASARDGLQAKTDRLRQLNDQQAAALQALQARLDASRAELASVSLQSAATAAYIAAALAAQQAEASSAASQSVWEQVVLLGGKAPEGGSPQFTDPLPGAVVTQVFGPTGLVFEPPFAGFAHFHTGLDVSTAEGTPVLAAASGTVVLAGFNAGGYGNFVVLAHAGGFDTLYGHLDSVLVRTGQVLQGGQPIGTEGSTGNSTGAHLHFELRRNGQPVDPGPYIRR